MSRPATHAKPGDAEAPFLTLCVGVSALYSLAAGNTTKLARSGATELRSFKSRPGHFTQWELSSISPNGRPVSIEPSANKT